jgi:hypothetical protein
MFSMNEPQQRLEHFYYIKTHVLSNTFLDSITEDSNPEVYSHLQDSMINLQDYLKGFNRKILDEAEYAIITHLIDNIRIKTSLYLHRKIPKSSEEIKLPEDVETLKENFFKLSFENMDLLFVQLSLLHSGYTDLLASHLSLLKYDKALLKDYSLDDINIVVEDIWSSFLTDGGKALRLKSNVNENLMISQW